MIRTCSSRYVTTADQTRPPIRPITIHRGSSVVRAGTSMRCGSRHNICASLKSIPCLSRFASLLAGSNSNSSMYKNHTETTHFALTESQVASYTGVGLRHPCRGEHSGRRTHPDPRHGCGLGERPRASAGLECDDRGDLKDAGDKQRPQQAGDHGQHPAWAVSTLRVSRHRKRRWLCRRVNGRAQVADQRGLELLRGTQV